MRSTHWRLEHRCRWRRLAGAGQGRRIDQQPVARGHDRARRRWSPKSRGRTPRHSSSLRPSDGFIAGADIKEFVGIRTPDQAYELIRQGQQVLDKLEALPCPNGRGHQRLRAGRRTGSRPRLSLSRARRRSGRDARLPRSAARRAPGIRRHRARRATGRPDRGDGPDAHRPVDPAETGARDGPGRSARAGRAARQDGEAGRAQRTARSQPEARCIACSMRGWCDRFSPARCARRSHGARGPTTTLPHTR